VNPVRTDRPLRAADSDLPVAHKRVEVVLQLVLQMESPRSGSRFGIEIASRVRSAELQRDDVIDLVLPRRVPANAVLPIDSVLRRFGNVADGPAVAGGANPIDVCRGDDPGRAASVGQGAA